MPVNEFNHRHHSTEHLYKFLDTLVILGSLLIALSVYGINVGPNYTIAALLAIVFYMAFADMLSIYSSDKGRAIKNRSSTILIASLLTFCSLLFIAYLTKATSDYSRVTMFLWFIFMPSLLVLWRIVVCRYYYTKNSKDSNLLKVAIIGANDIGRKLAETFNDDRSYGYNFVGYFDDRLVLDKERNNHSNDIILGKINEAIKQSKVFQIDVLYITLPMSAEKRIMKIVEGLSDTGISVHIIPNFFIYNLLHSSWHNVGNYQALSIYDKPFYGFSRALKFLEDYIFASIILFLISVPMLIIATAIKLTSKGPVIFKQKRYGINGNEVIVYKFRSMTVCDDGDMIKQAEKNDSRITPLGAFLRRTSLDELPQFINVLQGNMSIVGPRPHAVAHNEEYRHQVDGYMLRHLVKPGISGWAQINGYRGETKDIEKMKKRVEYDLAYIRNWSLFLDIKIIFLTVFKGFINKNAY